MFTWILYYPGKAEGNVSQVDNAENMTVLGGNVMDKELSCRFFATGKTGES